MTLILLKYKNYFNREAKREDSIQAYMDNSNGYLIVDDYDFNPADGVDTKVTIGGEGYDFIESNYILVCDGDTIVSRWYIMDADRTRYGQYKLNLHRDVIVDYLDTFKNEDMYVEKATVRDESPLIFNDEGVQFNKIKQKEYLLKDHTDVAWICGYIARKEFGGSGVPTGTIHIMAETLPDFTIIGPISSFDFSNGQKVYSMESNQMYIPVELFNTFDNRTITLYPGEASGHFIQCDFVDLHKDPSHYGMHPGIFNQIEGRGTREQAIQDFIAKLNEGFYNSYSTDAINYSQYQDRIDEDDFRLLSRYKDRYVQASDGLFKVTCTEEIIDDDGEITDRAPGSHYTYNTIKNAILHFRGTFTDVGVGIIKYKIVKRTVSIVQVNSGSYDITIPGPYSRYQLKDAPYDMFCIPCPIDKEEVTVKSTGTESFSEITMTRTQAITFAQGIAEQLGTFVYDIQLLPFCPLSVNVDNNKVIDIVADSSYRYTMITQTVSVQTVNKGILIWSLASNGHIEELKTSEDISEIFNINNLKISNQTDKIRLCSGSYNSAFEMIPARNVIEGDTERIGIRKLSADFTYIPYNSYIHVYPYFSRLYGDNFEDCRGLVDQNDKSISYLSDAWAQYQINNKTYLNSFDRDIQNMDTQRKYSRIQDIASALSGTVQGAAQGALLSGSPAGAIAGAVGSAAAGAADYYVNEKLFEESKSYARDKFEYSLENVRALPQTISKMTSYTKNNKVFPVVELYSCTDEEKYLLAQKIRNEGMTVNAIGTIGYYIQNSWSYNGVSDRGFIRGKFYKLNVDDDFHLTSAIEKEMEKGIYFKWE